MSETENREKQQRKLMKSKASFWENYYNEQISNQTEWEIRHRRAVGEKNEAASQPTQIRTIMRGY